MNMNAHSQYEQGTAWLTHSSDQYPAQRVEDTQPASGWTSTLHTLVGSDGILAQHGRVRVQLWPDQWVIAVRKSNRETWDPVSFHRSTPSLIRVLGEKSRSTKSAELSQAFGASRSTLLRLKGGSQNNWLRSCSSIRRLRNRSR
jgi:hypothetical protein